MDEILEQLKANKNFMWFGSRYMWNKSLDNLLGYSPWEGIENSDWDFMCSNSIENIEFVKKLGFVENTKHYYGVDPYYTYTVKVFKHPLYNIDVIFKDFFEELKIVFSSLDPDIYKYNFWKSSPFVEDPEQVKKNFCLYIYLAVDCLKMQLDRKYYA